MSRTGQTPINIPDGVNINITGQIVSAKGKLGELSATLMPEVEIKQQENKIIENSIRKHPSEYLWQHRRFKSTLGKEEFYK